MKRILVVLCLIFLAVQSPSPSSAESQFEISYNEAWDLLERAYSLSVYVNGHSGETSVKYNLHNLFGDYDNGGNIYHYYVYGDIAIQKAEEYANDIYTVQLAEKSWKYDSKNPAHKSRLLATNSDYNDPAYGDSDYWQNPTWDLEFRLFDESFFDDNDIDPFFCLYEKKLTIRSNSNGKATADVLIWKSDEVSAWPMAVSVEFAYTNEGWRISGGEFVNSMCNVTKTQYEKITTYDYYDFLINSTVYDLLVEEGFVGGVYSGSREKARSRCTYVSKKYVKYVFTLDVSSAKGEKIQGEYTAWFKYVSKKDYMANYKNQWDSNNYDFQVDEDTYLVFYDGGLFDLLIKGEVDAEQYKGEESAHTGDSELISSTLLSLAFAMTMLQFGIRTTVFLFKKKSNDS